MVDETRMKGIGKAIIVSAVSAGGLLALAGALSVVIGLLGLRHHRVEPVSGRMAYLGLGLALAFFGGTLAVSGLLVLVADRQKRLSLARGGGHADEHDEPVTEP